MALVATPDPLSVGKSLPARLNSYWRWERTTAADRAIKGIRILSPRSRRYGRPRAAMRPLRLGYRAIHID
jgi:hypothetical protein